MKILILIISFSFLSFANAQTNWNINEKESGSSANIKLEENLIIDVKIGPNPVSNTLVIKCNSEKYHVLVYDILGNLIVTRAFQNEGQVDVSHLNAGPYWIEIKTDSDIYTQKFIKK